MFYDQVQGYPWRLSICFFAGIVIWRKIAFQAPMPDGLLQGLKVGLSRNRSGTVKFIGGASFAKGTWVGIELAGPTVPCLNMAVCTSLLESSVVVRQAPAVMRIRSCVAVMSLQL